MTTAEGAGSDHPATPPYQSQLTLTAIHVLLCIDGDLDLDTAPRLELDLQRALAAAAPDRPVVIDLDQLRFCDLAGLDALAAAARTDDAGRRTVLIAAATGAGNLRPLLQLLERIGRPHPLPLHLSLDAAVTDRPNR